MPCDHLSRANPCFSPIANQFGQKTGGPPESAPEMSHKLAIGQLAALKEGPSQGSRTLLCLEWTLSGLAWALSQVWNGPHSLRWAIRPDVAGAPILEMVSLRSEMGPTGLR